MKIFKKILIVLAVCVVLIPVLLAALFYGVAFAILAHNYTGCASDSEFTYLIRDPIKKAAVSSYTYDPNSEDSVIVIPETYRGYPVKGIGGFLGRGAPGRFQIVIKNLHCSATVHPSNGSFDWYTKGKAFEIIYYDLTLQIGSNIREIFASASGAYESGDKLYIVRFYVNCDPDNPTYYSKRGILYQRKDDTVVSGFNYWNESF